MTAYFPWPHPERAAYPACSVRLSGWTSRFPLPCISDLRVLVPAFHRSRRPARAAQVVVKALTTDNPRPRYLIGPDAHAAAVVAQLPHRLRYRLTAARR